MQITFEKNPIVEVKPFLKWAGGKRQLIDEIDSRLPPEIKKTGKIKKYFEPFVGGGAIFFHLISNYDIKKSYLYDINKELILTYNVIKNNPNELIEELNTLSETYKLKSNSKEHIHNFYYDIREKFNDIREDFNFDNYSAEHIPIAAYMIFLNKTCFNGLYRVNSSNRFNVPASYVKNPLICDKENILNVSKVLKGTEIICSDYSESEPLIEKNSLVYLDPPYRPLTNNKSFDGYSKKSFDDNDQIELGEFFKRIDKKGANVILSNSDPKNTNKNDNFFDDIYKNFKIDRVEAKRFINSKGNRRGPINEIIVYNYQI